MNYWDKIVGKLLFISADKKDEQMKEMIKKLIVVSYSVKEACLGKFIKQANFLYAIAFFQWRYKYPNDVKWMKEDLEELIEQRQEFLYDKIKNVHANFETQLEAGYNSKTFAKHYDYIFLVEDQPYNINSFT